MTCEALVIGGGPAGLTAAMYLKRANRNVLLVRGKVKSALEWAHDINNYTGIKTITGPQLLADMTSQVEDMGVDIIEDDVIAITPNMNPKMASTKTAFITADTIIIATGKGKRKPVLKNELKYMGKGVSYCATCDGPLYKEKHTCIIGNDDEAAEDCLILHQMGVGVTWLVKEKNLNELDVNPGKISEIKKQNIKIIENAVDMALIGGDSVSGLKYQTKEGESGQIDCDCVFVMTSVPTSTLMEKAGIELSNNNIIVDRTQQTNIEGVYACGDICGNGFQVSIAVGEGAIAGMNAAKYLRKLKKSD